MKTEADAIAKERQLRRLENFMDVVYAVVIVMIFYLMPDPRDWDKQGLAKFLEATSGDFGLAALGIVVVLIYWIQNNILLGKLAATDNIHASLAILQVCVVLVYIVSVDLASVFPEEPMTLAIMSALVAIMGSLSAVGWWYASRRQRLLLPIVGKEEVNALRISVLAEPITALITLPFAFVSVLAWNASWLSYLLVAAILKRWRIPGL